MAASKQGRTVTVMAVGMNRRDRAALRLAFQMQQQAGRFELLEEGANEKPNLAVVDGDTPQGLGAWTTFRQRHPELPALYVSLTPVEIADGVYVARPLRVETLFPALAGLLGSPRGGGPARAQKVGTTTPPSPATTRGAGSTAPAERQLSAARRAMQVKRKVSTARGTPAAKPADSPAAKPADRPAAKPADAPAAKPADTPAPSSSPTKRPPTKVTPFVPPTYFDPDAGLLGLLRRLRSQHTGAWIDTPRKKGLMAVYPIEDKVYVDGELADLGEFCGDGLEVTHRPLGREGEALFARGQFPTVEAVLWQVAILTSRGRLPRGIRIANTTLALTRWPNLTRFAPIPSAMRIAAFLSQTPSSVTLTLKMLNVEAAYLYDFLSAAHCLGWLKQTEKAVREIASAPSTPPPASAAQGARRGLLSRLFHKLTGT